VTFLMHSSDSDWHSISIRIRKVRTIRSLREFFFNTYRYIFFFLLRSVHLQTTEAETQIKVVEELAASFAKASNQFESQSNTEQCVETLDKSKSVYRLFFGLSLSLIPSPHLHLTTVAKEHCPQSVEIKSMYIECLIRLGRVDQALKEIRSIPPEE
jgi:hypothetical protein